MSNPKFTGRAAYKASPMRDPASWAALAGIVAVLVLAGTDRLTSGAGETDMAQSNPAGPQSVLH